jgi:hypothetical protein
VSLILENIFVSAKIRIDFEVILLDSAMIEIQSPVYSENDTAKINIKSLNGYPGKVKFIAQVNNTICNSVTDSLIITIEE